MVTNADNPLPSPLSLPGEAWSDAVVRRSVRLGFKGGKPAAMEAYRALMRRGDPSLLPEPWRDASVTPPQIGEKISASGEGEVVKLLLGLPAEPGAKAPAERDLAQTEAHPHAKLLPVESVVIPMTGSTGNLKHTLCVSSQVGCAMGCEFCETAQMGLIRNLTAPEIVGQWFHAHHNHARSAGKNITNIVFMGMGEPLDNADEVLKAVEVLSDRNGANIAMSKITISTVGRVDGLRRLRAKCLEHGWKRLGIAISVNAPNDDVRNEIMPINRKWDMKELQDVLVGFPRSGRNRMMVEYVLIPGVNNLPGHAKQLAEFLRPIECCLNVIPYNPRRDSPWRAPSDDEVFSFADEMIALGVFTKLRRTKGRETMAACGQLGTEHIRQRKLVTPTISA